MTSEENSEEWKAFQELLSMTPEELDNVEHTVKRWQCYCKGCKNGTKIRDYGVHPFYYQPGKGKDRGWKDFTDWVLTCGKHWRWWRKMKKMYSEEQIQRRMWKTDPPLSQIVDLPNSPKRIQNKINK